MACPAGPVACETSVGNQKDLLLHFISIFYIQLLECRKVEYFESDLIPFECRFINHEQSALQHDAAFIIALIRRKWIWRITYHDPRRSAAQILRPFVRKQAPQTLKREWDQDGSA